MSAADARRSGEAAEIIRALRTSTNAEQVAAFVAVLRVVLDRRALDRGALDRGALDRGAPPDARTRQLPASAPPDRPAAQDRRSAWAHRTA